MGLLPRNLLPTALKLGPLVIARLLHASFVDINYKDYNNETTPFLTVHSIRLEYVTILFKNRGKDGKMDLDVPEGVYG